jgi:hypothetical protein
MNTNRSAPHMKLATPGAIILVARVAGAVLAAIRSAVASRDPSLPIFGRWFW